MGARNVLHYNMIDTYVQTYFDKMGCNNDIDHGQLHDKTIMTRGNYNSSK